MPHQTNHQGDLSALDRMVLEALNELQFYGTLVRDEMHISGFRITAFPKGVPLQFVELWLTTAQSYVPGCEKYWARETPVWAQETCGREVWDLNKRFEAERQRYEGYHPEKILTLDNRVNRLVSLGYVKRFKKSRWPYPDPFELVRYDAKTIRVVPCKKDGILNFGIAANIGDVDPKTREYVTPSLLMAEGKGDGFDFVRLQQSGITEVRRWQPVANSAKVSQGNARRQSLESSKARESNKTNAKRRKKKSLGGNKRSKPTKTGYVAKPSDPSSYVSVAVIITEYCERLPTASTKTIIKIIEDYKTNGVRWSRPLTNSKKPHPQRRSVHLVDWRQYIVRLSGNAKHSNDGFPGQSEAEIEATKVSIRRRHKRGK